MMKNKGKTDEIMSISFNISENNIPCIVFCSEFSVPMTNKTFIKSYITNYENDMKFKLGHLSCNSLKLSWYIEEKELLEVSYKKKFMGLALASELYTNLLLCSNQLQELKTSYEQET